jgi:hypothetical protein
MTGSRRRWSVVAHGACRRLSGKDETTVNLNQGDSRVMVNSFKLYNFYADWWSVCDIVEYEERDYVAGGGTWRLGVSVEIMKDSSSAEYMKV